MDQSESEIREVEETNSKSELQPLLETHNPSSNSKSVKTKVPEIEIHLFRQGKGPIDVFKSSLGGWDQDQLEVRDILDKYGFKSVFAFKPDSGRGVPIRFNPRNGRSILTYRDGAEIFIDGEPKLKATALTRSKNLVIFVLCLLMAPLLHQFANFHSFQFQLTWIP
ncbi:hypothetical protein Csa_005539 [Cucumis sativus]|nr:hypothetical protein Csa_005539 [Cucumis sativus]